MITNVTQAQCEALVDLYNSTNGPSWSNNTNWDTTTSVTTWYGLSLNPVCPICPMFNVTGMDLSGNNLSGTIPSTIGDLGNLLYLNLSQNNLSGNIPGGIGSLTLLETLNLANNQLSGQIPTQIGSLTHLLYLYLEGNQLSGSVPTSIGNLTALYDCRLNENRFSGAIPSQFGNMSGLVSLQVQNNRFSGDIPATLTNTNLTQFIWSYNMLTASDPALMAFLNSIQQEYYEYQTIPPDNLGTSNITASSIRITWDPILYTGDGGYYTVRYSETSGGPYTTAGNTADKFASSFDVTGLSPGTDYYFVVQTYTPPHGQQQNALTSSMSAQVSASTLNTPPTTTGIPDLEVPMNSDPSLIDLTLYFNDAEDGPNGLNYSILNIAPSGLIASAPIQSGTLTLNYVTDASGMANVTVRATDSGGLYVEDIFTVTITSGNTPPTTTGLSNVTVPVNSQPVPVSLTESFDDIEDGPWGLNYEVYGNTHTSLVLTQILQGELILSFTQDMSGQSEITIRATDTGSLFVDSTFTVVVSLDNTQPVTTGIANVAANEDDQPFTVNLLSSFDDAEDGSSGLAYEVFSNSAPTLFTSTPISGGSLTLNFEADANGSADITIRATDTGGLYVDAPFAVTISPVNDPPTFTPGPNQSVPVNAGPQTVTGWATNISPGPPDESVQTVYFSVDTDNSRLFSTLPEIDPSGTLTYTPESAVSGDAQVNAVLWDSLDGAGPPAVFTISIGGQIEPPVITGQNPLSTPEDTPLTITLEDLFVQDPQALYPEGFTLSVGDGSFFSSSGNTIIPATDYYGPLTVPVSVSSNGVTSDPFSLAITVTPVNDPPTFSGNPATTAAVGVPYENRFSAYDPDGDQLIFNAVTLPSWLTLVPDSGGFKLVGTPQPGDSGNHDVSIQIVDPENLVETVSFVIAVETAANQAPMIVGQKPLTGGEGSHFTIELADLIVEDPDNEYPEGFTLDVRQTGIPIGDEKNDASAVALGDVDGDGDLDLVVGHTGRPDTLYLNNGTEKPFHEVPGVDVSSDDYDTLGLRLVDADEDGDLDLIAGGGAETLRRYINNGTLNPFDGTMERFFQPMALNGPQAMGDVDGLGQPDLVAVVPDTGVFLFPGEVYEHPFYLIGADGSILPVADNIGSIQVPVSVSDGELSSPLYPVEIPVTQVNDPPVIVGQRRFTMPEYTEHALPKAENERLTILLTDLAIMDPDSVFPDDFTLEIEDGDHYTHAENAILPEKDFRGILPVLAAVKDADGQRTIHTIRISVGPDADGDGMDDAWEEAHGLNPQVDDAGEDPDGDGFLNIEEYRCRTEPLNRDAFPGPPIADAGENQSVAPNTDVQLNGFGSRAMGDVDLSFEWRQIEGTDTPLVGASTAFPQFTANGPERLEFRLTVSDPCGYQASDSCVVFVGGGSGIIAHAGPDIIVYKGDHILLDGSDSYFPDGDLSYFWEKIDGQSVLINGDSANPVWEFLAWETGETTYRLTVQNAGMESSDTCVVDVRSSAVSGNRPPEKPVWTNPENESVIPFGTPVRLSASNFNDPENDRHILSYWIADSHGINPECAGISSDEYHITGPQTELEVNGLSAGKKYGWRVAYEDAGSETRSPWSDILWVKMGESSNHQIRIEPGDNSASFPMKSFFFYPDDPKDTAFFRDVVGVGDPRYFLIGTYDPMVGGYVKYGQGLVIEPGRAYWIFARNGLSFQRRGVPVTKQEDVEVRLLYNPATEDGWNMIAPPGDADVPVSLLRVRVYEGCDIMDEKPISELPEDNPYIETSLAFWKDGRYLPETEILKSGNGYWARARRSGISLVFPASDALQKSERKITTKSSDQTAIADQPPAPPEFSSNNQDQADNGGCFFSTIGPEFERGHAMIWITAFFLSVLIGIGRAVSNKREES